MVSDIGDVSIATCVGNAEMGTSVGDATVGKSWCCDGGVIVHVVAVTTGVGELVTGQAQLT